MSIAFVFPGQGSHRAGTLAAWAQDPASAVLDEVSEGIGRDVRALADDDTAGSRTADAQPAILASSLVCWRALSTAGVRPDAVAGHSLGEYTAAIAAGALSVRDGAALVAARGAAMGEACAANPGTMAAVVKLGTDAVSVLVDGIEDLVIANDNAPGQVVLAGSPDAIALARERAREAGGRAVPLDVEGAFHSPAMAPAVPAVRAALARVEVNDPGVPLISGSTATPVSDAERLQQALVDGILSPVRWRQVQERLREMGVTDVVEVGPGGVLAGLAKRTMGDDVRVHGVASPDELDDVLGVLPAVPAQR